MSLSLRAAVLMPYHTQCNDEARASPARGRGKPGKRHGNTDLRIRRTRERLGAALIALIEKNAIHEVTIREVLDRA